MTNRRDPLAGLRLGRAQLGIKLWKGSALLAVTQAHAGGYRCYSHAISRAHGRKLWPSAEAALAAWLGTLPTRIEATLNPPGMPLAFASGAVTVYVGRGQWRPRGAAVEDRRLPSKIGADRSPDPTQVRERGRTRKRGTRPNRSAHVRTDDRDPGSAGQSGPGCGRSPAARTRFQHRLTRQGETAMATTRTHARLRSSPINSSSASA